MDNSYCRQFLQLGAQENLLGTIKKGCFHPEILPFFSQVLSYWFPWLPTLGKTLAGRGNMLIRNHTHPSTQAVALELASSGCLLCSTFQALIFFCKRNESGEPVSAAESNGMFSPRKMVVLPTASTSASWEGITELNMSCCGGLGNGWKDMQESLVFLRCLPFPRTPPTLVTCV